MMRRESGRMMRAHLFHAEVGLAHEGLHYETAAGVDGELNKILLSHGGELLERVSGGHLHQLLHHVAGLGVVGQAQRVPLQLSQQPHTKHTPIS